MRLPIIQIVFLLMPIGMWCQTGVKDSLTDNYPFKSIEQILKDSKKINNETFDLKFLIRVLPDNGWFLKLNKDSTFNYIHWSGWGESDGTIIEKGTYTIIDNRLKLKSNIRKSDLKNIKFYLITSQTDSIDNNITIDCVKDRETIYCLYRK